MEERPTQPGVSGSTNLEPNGHRSTQTGRAKAEGMNKQHRGRSRDDCCRMIRMLPPRPPRPKTSQQPYPCRRTSRRTCARKHPTCACVVSRLVSRIYNGIHRCWLTNDPYGLQASLKQCSFRRMSIALCVPTQLPCFSEAPASHVLDLRLPVQVEGTGLDGSRIRHTKPSERQLAGGKV